MKSLTFLKEFGMMIVCCAWLMIATVSTAADDDPIRLVQKFKASTLNQLGHLDLDTKRDRLFIPMSGTHTVEVLDLGTGQFLKPIKNMGAPKDVLYMPEFDAIAVSSGTHGMLFFFDAETLKPSGSVELERNCNYLRYDPKAHEIYVANGVGVISVIDAEARKVMRKFELGSPIATFEIELNGDRLFVTIPNLSVIAVLNRRTGEEIARWPIEEAIATNPVVTAYDEARQRLFVACRKPPRFVAIDANTGKVMAPAMGMIADCETMAYDARTDRVYATCGSGTIDIFKQIAPDKLYLEARIPTATAARTSLFVPERRRLYVPVPASRGEDSHIFVYETEPFGETSATRTDDQAATKPSEAASTAPATLPH